MSFIVKNSIFHIKWPFGPVFHYPNIFFHSQRPFRIVVFDKMALESIIWCQIEQWKFPQFSTDFFTICLFLIYPFPYLSVPRNAFSWFVFHDLSSTNCPDTVLGGRKTRRPRKNEIILSSQRNNSDPIKLVLKFIHFT
jgi:hypothetical protein